MDETVKTDEDKYKMSNPYFAQFSANSLEGYSEILMWRAYNLLDYKIVHSAPFYIRVVEIPIYPAICRKFPLPYGKPIYATDQYKG